MTAPAVNSLPPPPSPLSHGYIPCDLLISFFSHKPNKSIVGNSLLLILGSIRSVLWLKYFSECRQSGFPSSLCRSSHCKCYRFHVSRKGYKNNLLGIFSSPTVFGLQTFISKMGKNHKILTSIGLFLTYIVRITSSYTLSNDLLIFNEKTSANVIFIHNILVTYENIIYIYYSPINSHVNVLKFR